METEEEEVVSRERRKPKYIIQDGIEIWPKDSLPIERFICTMVPSEERNILKRLSVDLLFQKHPYHLCSSSVSIFADGLVWEPVEHIRVPQGRIVGKSVETFNNPSRPLTSRMRSSVTGLLFLEFPGLQRYSEELLMSCHETGVLSLVYHKNGALKYMEGSANSIKSGPKSNIYGYNGFVFSTNGALAFIGKQ